jgi:putative transposase
VAEICRRHGISDATFYTWRSKYGGLEVSDAKRLRRLRRRTASSRSCSPDAATLREMLGKNF